MGQLLSKPVEEKTIEHQSHDLLTYCIGSMQGYRMSMEDAHDVKLREDESIGVFGVFDGHGGKQCSLYLSQHLLRMIFRRLKQGEELQEQTVSLTQRQSIIKDSFFAIDKQLEGTPSLVECGSTAIVATYFRDQYIIVANTGDSRCILSVDGQAKNMSYDHKPTIMNERIRVENSNGYVLNNRINEILALSRAFGDFRFKSPYLSYTKNKYILQNLPESIRRQSIESVIPKQHLKLVHLPPELYQITVEPDFLVYDLVDNVRPEFMVIACDGIWDCFKNQDLIKLIRDKLGLGWQLPKITEYALNECLVMANNYTGIGFDNMTMIIVAFHQEQTMNEWYDMMKDKVLKEKNLV
ncbi:uncharacterized protein KQ657_001921 [Scheffersomyces spartinae]|uniref:protein-serine/threonine phosphatase n=1 Tax=Scheffersomyces spartinae TaxID=45513 RepID=A0A9P7V6C8_9ASCO|nr:uncharacterized protein KQ657_001921 [Scheffersomyces spartinae]KAG7192203.1 hypothetical protein KQ657_001921 [Scheffersomyces spartinae]